MTQRIHATPPTIAPPSPSLFTAPARGSTESRATRWLFHLVALVLTIGYGFFLFSFWAPGPSRPGIDENAYLLAGRNFVERGSAGYRPSNDYEYVGAMWVRSEDGQAQAPKALPRPLREKLSPHIEAGWYYPKYPAGLPLLNGVMLKIFGGPGSLKAAERTLLLAPACMVLSVLGMFYLTRKAVGSSFLAVCAMIVLGCLPASLELSIMANSHAPALVFVVWGMFFLVSFLKTPHWYLGAAAGFCLGYAVTIRYTEALLLFPLFPLDQVLADTGLKEAHPHWWSLVRMIRLVPLGPIGIVALSAVFQRKREGEPRASVLRRLIRAGALIGAWCVPVGLLVGFNWFTLGTITGYDTTQESTGFTTAEFLRKWDFTIHQVYLFGLFLILPLGLAGLATLFRGSKRLGLVMVLWFVPGTLLYNAYYWGEEAPGVAFLRFFLTLFPPLIVAAFYLIHAADVGGAAVRPMASEPRENTLDDASSPAADSGGGDRGNSTLETNELQRETALPPLRVLMPARRRGSFVVPLGAGILTFATAAVAFTGGLPSMERQHRGNLNLDVSLHAIQDGLAQCPAKGRPVIFADAGLFPQLLQVGQFMLPGDWYTVDAFDAKIGGGFGAFGLMQANEKDSPVLIQKARLLHINAFRKGKTDADLIADFNTLVADSAKAGRPVVVVLTQAQEQPFRKRYVAGNLELVQRVRWAEPCAIKPIPQAGSGRKGLAGRSGSPLVPDVFLGEPLIRWSPLAMKLYELREKPSATTRPAPDAAQP